MHTKIDWFEIPSRDFHRAVKFYETVLDTKLRIEQFGDTEIGVFTTDGGDSIGSVICSERYAPNAEGPVLYLNAEPSIATVLARIEPAGGRVKMEKFELPDGAGFIAHFFDTEGNRLGLHAMA